MQIDMFPSSSFLAIIMKAEVSPNLLFWAASSALEDRGALIECVEIGGQCKSINKGNQDPQPCPTLMHVNNFVLTCQPF